MIRRRSMLPPAVLVPFAAAAAFAVAAGALLAVAVAGCDLGGCANGVSCGFDTPVNNDLALPATCPTTCAGGCAAGQQCVTPAAITGLHAFCASACADDRDCGAGARCLSLFAAMAPSVCVADSVATLACASTAGQICDTQAACADAQTANVPFSDAARGICGWQVEHCANGCSSGACN